MRIRGKIVLCLLVLFLLSCSRTRLEIPPTNTSSPENPPQTSSEIEQPAAEMPQDTSSVPEIVLILRQMDEDAQDYMQENNLLAAHQVFEEALDLMTIYEEECEEELPRDYLIVKQQVLSDFKELLKKENIDLHETALDILLEEINILEKDIEDTVSVDATSNSISEYPLVMNNRVLQAISYFENRGRRTFEIWLQRSGKYLPMIFEILEEEGLPRELAYLSMIESGLRPSVVSRARAVGMWQFISATGKRYDLKINGFVDERRDPVKSTKAAARHLKDLYYYWNNDWFIALAAYNVSERRIRRDMKRNKTENYWELRSLPRQTRNYIPTFIAAATIASNPRKYGFEPPVMQAWTYDRVKVERQTSIDVLAQAAGISETTLIDLNTELLNWITPNTGDYEIRLPKGSGERFSINFAAMPDNELITKVVHRVRRGETISHIADAYRTSITQIMRVNNIRNPRILQIGQRLTIPIKPKSFKSIERAIIASSVSRPRIPRDAAQRRKISYTVRKNDTLWDIAQSYKQTVSDLRAWNSLNRRSMIYPNQKLTVWLSRSASQAAGNQAQSTTGTADASTNRAFVHIVRRGDTVSGISDMYRVPLGEILSLNNLRKNSIIYPGDKIKLYLDNTDADITGNREDYPVYTVRPGDTLWEIARRFGTTVPSIQRLNNRRNTRIHPGEKLLIPSQDKKPSTK